METKMKTINKTEEEEMEKYTVFDLISGDKICVMAGSHIQHIWSETCLLGISCNGAKRLSRFMEQHKDGNIRVNAGPYNPRLIGFEIKEERKK